MINLLATTCFFLQRAIEIQDSAGLILRDEEAAEYASCLQKHLRSYVELAGYHYDHNKMLYKIRHKSHYLVHVRAEVLTYKINQRLYHTWEDESFLGKLKAIAVRCHGKTVTFRIYQRYLLAFAIFLQEHRRSAGEEEHLP